jgi:hypothetical protein
MQLVEGIKNFPVCVKSDKYEELREYVLYCTRSTKAETWKQSSKCWNLTERMWIRP